MPDSPAIKFFDPLTERWIVMPTKPPPVKVIEPEENSYTKTVRLVRQMRIWQAIEATATATQMSKPCRDGSESDASES